MLLEKAEKQLRQLLIDRLLVAIDFISYLAEREENETTQELLEIPGFTTAFQAAQREVEADEITDFEQIKRDV